MSREIKFRAWDGKNMFLSGECNVYQLGQWMIAHSGVMNEKQSLLLRFTGLKDKNGVEIYEGDILNAMSGEVGVMTVKFMDGSFICYNRFGKWGLLSRCFDYDIKQMEYDCEVIGNIHQNPELLK